MSHRSFSAAVPASTEPTTFELQGVTFTARPDMPFGAFVNASNALRRPALEQFTALTQVVRSWIVEEQRPRFDEVLLELGSLDVLVEVIQFLMEDASGRPTPASSA